MTEKKTQIRRLRAQEEQARSMAAKSPFKTDREKFAKIADGYRDQADKLEGEGNR